MSLDLRDATDIIMLTLRVTLTATFIGAIVGIPIGAWFSLHEGRSRRLLRIALHTLYSLPPILAGLAIYLLLRRDALLGSLGLLFTPTAIILAESLLTIPLVAGLTFAAMADVPPHVSEAVRASGARRVRITWTLLHEARRGVLAGVAVALGRTLAEVGAALVVGGNIRGETRTVGTAIVQEVDQGQYGAALTLGAILLTLALLTVLALARLEPREARP